MAGAPPGCDAPCQPAGVKKHFNVVAVLLAEFDIDRGSVLRHTYPPGLGFRSEAADSKGHGGVTAAEGPLSDCTRHQLAEMMLPEGVHHHAATDWTAFLVRRCGQVRGLLQESAAGDGALGPVSCCASVRIVTRSNAGDAHCCWRCALLLSFGIDLMLVPLCNSGEHAVWI